MNENEDILNKEMTPEELKLALEQNDYLKLNLKIMNDLPLIEPEGESEPDYNKLAANVSLNKKLESVVEYTPESMSFYYGLISNGYDCFGEDYIIKLVTKYPDYTCLILHLFMGYVENMTAYLEAHETKSDEESK